MVSVVDFNSLNKFPVSKHVPACLGKITAHRFIRRIRSNHLETTVILRGELPPWAVTRFVTYSLKKRNDMFVLVATVAGASNTCNIYCRNSGSYSGQRLLTSDMMRTGKLTQKTTEPVLHWDIIRDVEEILTTKCSPCHACRKQNVDGMHQGGIYSGPV